MDPIHSWEEEGGWIPPDCADPEPLVEDTYEEVELLEDCGC